MELCCVCETFLQHMKVSDIFQTILILNYHCDLPSVRMVDIHNRRCVLFLVMNDVIDLTQTDCHALDTHDIGQMYLVLKKLHTLAQNISGVSFNEFIMHSPSSLFQYKLKLPVMSLSIHQNSRKST